MQNVGPNFFIVGAAKSGTSALANFIGQHPDVFFSSVKEPYFFITNPEISREEYFSLFSGGESYSVRGEATTGYLFDKSSPDLISSYCPEAKIIIILRRPEVMALSLWRYMCTNGNETEEFIKAINDRDIRKTQHFIESRTGRPENYLYIERAMYSEQIERYFRYFDKKNIKMIIYERFKSNQVNVVKEIYEFLGVDNMFTPQIRAINVTGTTRSLFLHKLIHRRYPILKKIVPLVIRNKLRQNAKLLNTNITKAANVDNESLLAVRQLLEDDIEKTRVLLNDKISEWN